MLVILKTPLDFKSSFLHLIGSLCVFDSLCILFNITIFSGPLLSESYRHQVITSHPPLDCMVLQVLPHLIPLVLPLAQVSLTSSVYTIVALAGERWLAVTRSENRMLFSNESVLDITSYNSWVSVYYV